MTKKLQMMPTEALDNELFNVVQFLADGSHEYVRQNVSAQEAAEAAGHYCTSVGAKLGFCQRVIVTDRDDCCVFEWIRGKGITWPTGFEDSVRSY